MSVDMTQCAACAGTGLAPPGQGLCGSCLGSGKVQKPRGPVGGAKVLPGGPSGSGGPTGGSTPI
jgi:DnaJ-class molecular chaperone